jgi:ParB family transcriptional regulator, chromosome partitioning protein
MSPCTQARPHHRRSDWRQRGVPSGTPVGSWSAGRSPARDRGRRHQPNPDQPRKHFDEDALRSLADSIRERGVLQPIIVRPRATGGYELVAGERRWRAAQLAGHLTISALVDANVEGARSLELALIENVVREDLTPIEEARTIVVLLHDLRVTSTVLATRLGRSRTDLAHTVRLLDLPDRAIELIDGGVLTKGHGKALLTEADHHRPRVLAERAARDGWSIRTLEAEIARESNPHAKPQPPHPDHEAAAAKLQDVLTRATGYGALARPHRHGSGGGCFGAAATPSFWAPAGAVLERCQARRPGCEWRVGSASDRTRGEIVLNRVLGVAGDGVMRGHQVCDLHRPAPSPTAPSEDAGCASPFAWLGPDRETCRWTRDDW